MTPTEAAKILAEFNHWRRGEPPYDWSDDPKKRKELPYTPQQIGEAIDVAVSCLNKSPQRTVIERIWDAACKARSFWGYGDAEPLVVAVSRPTFTELLLCVAERERNNEPTDPIAYAAPTMTIYGMKVVESSSVDDFVVLTRLDVEKLADAVDGILLTGTQLISFTEWANQKIETMK